jgi:hypothetical protein
MSLKPSVLILSSITGLAALTGIWIGCQSQQASQPGSQQSPAPLLSPSVTASAPVPSVPNSTGTPTPSSETPSNSTGTPTPSSETSPSPTKLSQSRGSDTPAKNTGSQPPSTQPLNAPKAEMVRNVEKCTISMAKVKDPNPPLNVRSTPNTDSEANIIGKLQNGEFVFVEEQKDDWFRIKDPLKGWVAKSRTDNTCNLKIERVQFGQGQTSATIEGRFIGGGTHSYHFNLAKGQRVKVVTNRGPLPTILAPNNKELSGINDDKRSWTGDLAVSGDYVLQFDSNYKGYEYSFTIAAE